MLGTEGEKIFEDHFLRVKELEDKNIEEIKEEYEFDKIKDAFDEGAIPRQLDFFYGEEYLSENVSVSSCHLMMKALDLLIFFALTEVKIL